MTNDECLEVMRRVEESFPVDQWSIDGLHIWPLVRYEIHQDNLAYLDAHRAATEASTAQAKIRHRWHRMAEVGSGAARALSATIRDPIVPTHLRSASTILYSDGVLFSKLDGLWYDRVCDPLIDTLDANGVSHLLLTPLHNHFFPRRSPSLFVQPAIDAATLYANVSWVARAANAPNDTRAPGFAEARAMIESMGLPTGRLDLTRIRRTAHFVDTYARLYERILRSVGARSAFIVCYYGAERAAMCLACRRLGIPSVDIQHGAAGEARYWAYASWDKVPTGGYALLPDYFWCWSTRDVAEIERWTLRLDPPAHRPVAAGNLFLTRWRDGELDAATRYDAQVASVASGYGAREHVLVTLNGYEDDAKLARMAHTARKTQEQLQYWWRAHPSRWQQRATLDRVVREHSLDNVDVGVACDAPLFALLRNVQYHATEVSSVAFEAEAFGVPTVFTHPGEAVGYMPIVERGWGLVVDAFEDLPSAVARLRESWSTRAAGVAAQRDTEARGLERMVRVARGEWA